MIFIEELTLTGRLVSIFVYGMSCSFDVSSGGSWRSKSKCFISSEDSFDLASLGDLDLDLIISMLKLSIFWRYSYLCLLLFLRSVATISDSVSIPEFRYPYISNMKFIYITIFSFT